jgi:hypothetical protein
MVNNVRVDYRGVGAIMRSSEMHRTIQEATEEVARKVESRGIRVDDRDGGPAEDELPVKTGVITTDRAHGVVTLAHPSGLAVQAKHGALTKAAAEAGLEVGGR